MRGAAVRRSVSTASDIARVGWKTFSSPLPRPNREKSHPKIRDNQKVRILDGKEFRSLRLNRWD